MNQDSGKDAQNPSSESSGSLRPAETDGVAGQPPERVWVAISSLLRGYGYTYLANDEGGDIVEYVRADKVLAAFPDSWLDPLLTGPNAVVGKPPFGCPDIERLLAAIKERIVSTQDTSIGVAPSTTVPATKEE